MPDREKIIRGLRDIDMFIAGRLGYEKAKNFLRTIDEAIVLLKEQETANLYKCPNCGTWVSAEDVVRCKDCKHFDGLDCSVNDTVNIMNTDWFCADGEKKDAENH